MAKVKWFLCIVPLVIGLVILPGGLAAVYGDEDHGGASMNMTGSGDGKVKEFPGMHGPIWRLGGDKPFLIGGYGDNFSYDGTRVVPLVGKAKASLDNNKNTGTAMFRVYGTINPEKKKSYTGEIAFYFTPGEGGPAFQEGGVADFVYLHGDTGQDAPVMPKVRTFLASWGKAEVYVNGKLVYPELMGHIMYTEGSRDHVSQEVYNARKIGHYDPKNPADGSVADPNARELHFVAHNMKEDKGNFPPHAVWLHVNFEGAGEIAAVGCSCGCGMSSCGCGGTGGCGLSKGSCGVAGCGCGCADGGPCGCAAAGKVSGKGKCGVAGCGCGCADGGPCGCAAAGKVSGKGKCGVAGCGCGCADGGPCGCAAAGKVSGKGKCGVASCGCGCADGGPCGCAAAGKVSGKGKCGVAGCGCGCADGGPCGCAAAGKAHCGCPEGKCDCADCSCGESGACTCKMGNVPTRPNEQPQGAPKFDM